ncbi:MAG TPA: GrpB family protein [Isosphaeraceae bacterium]|jgi:GrpB-like predicted nucleotidyltransferase (UPF0157 family)|nr:GrpB family protein [Isosphaeraceae bacterium]
MSEPITLVDYDPIWPEIFEELRAPLVAAVGDLVVAVEHIGSTAVPGLAAKPIIDLDLVVPSSDDLPVAIARLAALGYAHQGDLGVPGREAFLPPSRGPKHHLYACPSDSESLRRHIVFRDYLLSHPQAAAGYEAVKKAAALRFREDRVAYVEAKSRIIEEILRKASSEP